ncbi:MAG TPA: glycosyltransferase [Solirubrobacteraceae bacterium]|nr:glycosyltransferase [Solirubrobacteraceae bacterium]
MALVAVIASAWPAPRDPVAGLSEQRLLAAAAAAGADLRVLVLERHALGRFAAPGPLEGAAEPAPATIPYRGAPAGRGAAASLRRALRRLARERPVGLLHALGPLPAGALAHRARPDLPLLVSLAGGEVLHAGTDAPSHTAQVSATLAAAEVVAAPSSGTAALAAAAGARRTLVIHPGSDLPAAQRAARAEPACLVTIGRLEASRRHGDVLRALAVLADAHPDLRYEVIGEGPERSALEALARRLDVAGRVQFSGALAPDEALARVRAATLLVMPSVDEAFGVSYVEAMAAGVPAIGCRGEAGPEDIAAAGDGLTMVPPGDIERLSQRLDELLGDPARLREAGERARATVSETFTWERSGAQLAALYEELARSGG